jgi:hypothetical protein
LRLCAGAAQDSGCGQQRAGGEQGATVHGFLPGQSKAMRDLCGSNKHRSIGME